MFCLSVRYVLAILVFLGTLFNYATRVTINIAILEMTKNSSLCANTSSNSIENEEGEKIFCWSNWDQGLVKASFYYGYPLTQLLGGYLAERYGTKYVFGGQNFLAACLTMLTPLTARIHVWMVIVLRFIMGLVEGVTYPALPPMINKWIPEQERARFVSFSYLGGAFGSAVAFPICGLLIEAAGWESVFYVIGSITVIWCILWFLYVTDDPRDHKTINVNEKNYISENLGEEKVKPDVTFKILSVMLKNPTIWVIMICDFVNIWGILVIINEGPNFISKILERDISTNGLLSALPHLWTMVAGQIFGFLSDILLVKDVLPKTYIRKIMHTFGFLLPGIGLGLMGYIIDDWRISVAIMTIGYGFRGATYSGHTQSPLELAPTYSGTIYGICNGFGALSGMICPIVATALTANDPYDIDSWRILFLLTMALYIFSWVIYVLFVKIKPLPFDPLCKKTEVP